MTRIALFGTGAFAREHIAALVGDPRVEIKYVVSHSLERARATASLAPGAIGTTNVTAALGPDVDAVDIVTANTTHAALAIAAGQAHKHVHVDKPAALSLPDFDAMAAAVESSGKTFMVGQTVRFQPAVTQLAEQIQSGEIGDPHLAHITWYTGHVWSGGWRSWVLDQAQSGGHPVHNGTHILDAAGWLLGSVPRRVFTRSFTTFAPQMGVPDSFTLLVEFENGSLATLELCYALRKRGDMLRRVLVAGSRGTIVHSTAGESGLVTDTPNAPISIDNALTSQLRHWISLVKGEQAPIVTTAQARGALRGALAAQRSLELGRIVTVTEVEAS